MNAKVCEAGSISLSLSLSFAEIYDKSYRNCLKGSIKEHSYTKPFCQHIFNCSNVIATVHVRGNLGSPDVVLIEKVIDFDYMVVPYSNCHLASRWQAAVGIPDVLIQANIGRGYISLALGNNLERCLSRQLGPRRRSNNVYA